MSCDDLYDYASPNLEYIALDEYFPDMVIGEKNSSTWPYLRKDNNHIWRVDQRDPFVGFLNRDESIILYNSAKLAVGLPCLEIGCWRGYSTAYLAKGAGSVDVIDPVLQNAEFAADIKNAMKRIGVSDAVRFHAGRSPEMVDILSEATKKKWAFAFVDGDHDGDAPVRDAEAVASNADDNAIILFHDLASPHVARALEYLHEAGWNVMIYLTAQIMGVAWRGSMVPVKHIPDPKQTWSIPDHLKNFPISAREPSNVAMKDLREKTLGENSRFEALGGKLLKLTRNLEELEVIAREQQKKIEIYETQISLGEAERQRSEDRCDLLVDRLMRLQQKHALLTEEHQRDLRRLTDRSSMINCQPIDGHANVPNEMQVDAFIDWLLAPRTLTRLLRYRFTRPRQAARDLLTKRLTALALAEVHGDAIEWLVSRRTLAKLLSRVIRSRRGFAREKVKRVLSIASKEKSNDLRVGHIPNVALNIAEDDKTELMRLRAVEQAKLEDEKTIADLRVEVAVLTAMLGDGAKNSDS